MNGLWRIKRDKIVIKSGLNHFHINSRTYKYLQYL